MDAFAAVRFVAGLAFLLVAAASDVRTRRVRDLLWVVMGSLGLLLVSVEIVLFGASYERFGLVAAAGILFAAIFYGRPLFEEDGFHLRPVRIGVFLGAGALVLVSIYAVSGRESESAAVVGLLSLPIMVLVYQGFYQVGLLHGGADAKGLVALTLLVPTYPEASPFPLLLPDPRVADPIRVAFPFSLVVFVDAAVLFIAIPFAYLVYNAARGDLAFPQALLGYRANLDPPPRHAWAMERIDPKGEHLLVLFPRRGRHVDREFERLRAAGFRRAWVQPKIPFMVPLLAGYVLAFVVGNVIFLLFRI